MNDTIWLIITYLWLLVLELRSASKMDQFCISLFRLSADIFIISKPDLCIALAGVNLNLLGIHDILKNSFIEFFVYRRECADIEKWCSNNFIADCTVVQNKNETPLFISIQIIIQKWNWYQSSWISVYSSFML